MNYIAHYDRLITSALNRALTGYCERHHIKPRCMGGSDASENIVSLTPEEHYVAHQLLVKIYPKNVLLLHAAIFMTKRITGNKAYGWLKRRQSEAMRGNQRAAGLVHSLEAKYKLRMVNLGKIHSLESRKKMSMTHLKRKRVLSEAYLSNCKRMGTANRGKIHSEETRAKMSAAHIGKPKSPEHSAKLAAGLRAYWLERRAS